MLRVFHFAEIGGLCRYEYGESIVSSYAITASGYAQT